MLSSVARSCFRHKWRTLGAWLVVLVAISTLGSMFAGEWSSQGSLPGTDSQAAQDILAREFPARSGDSGSIVIGDVTRDRARVDALLASVAAVPGVARVGDLEVAPDGRIAQAEVTFASGQQEAEALAAVDGIKALVEPARDAGVQVELSGGWFGEGGMPASELFGLLAAALILVLAFGSVVAAGVPILTAVVGVGIAMAGVSLWANVLDTASFTPQVAAMIGIGVGIDYALFILTRYRAALERGSDREDAVAEAMATAGRAVVFAGCTVVVSLLGMLIMGLSFLHGLAVGTSCAVLVAVLAAVTLVPAMLGVVGRRIDSLHIGRRRSPSAAGGLWARWARFVQRRPAAVAGAGLARPRAGGGAGVRHAPGLRRRRQRADHLHHPPGPRSARGRLRRRLHRAHRRGHGHQRPGRGRRRRPGARRAAEAAGRGVGLPGVRRRSPGRRPSPSWSR